MDALQTHPLTMCTTKAGMSAGTTTTLTTANTQLYCIGGKAFTKAAASNEATPTTDAATGAAFVGVAAGYGSVYVICRDASAALKAVQGQVVALDASGNFVTAPQFPGVPDSLCPIGYIVVKAAAGASTWVFGSSNLAGPPSNVSFSFVDCMTLPGRPQVS